MMEEMNILQTVAILVDGNNMDKSANTLNESLMVDYDKLVPRLIGRRSLSRFFYLREGRSISKKLAERLHIKFYGIVKPCHKSADVPLTIEAVQLVDKVDTIIIMSGDSDYVELVKYLSARGIRTEIAAFKFSASSYLLEATDFYHEITADDCFTTDKPQKYVEPGSDQSVAPKSKKQPKSKKPGMKKIEPGTPVVDAQNSEITGKIVTYNHGKKCYIVMLDSGTETNWKRSAFNVLINPAVAV